VFVYFECDRGHRFTVETAYGEPPPPWGSERPCESCAREDAAIARNAEKMGRTRQFLRENNRSPEVQVTASMTTGEFVAGMQRNGPDYWTKATPQELKDRGVSV
jgi:hypothetical protein